MLYLRQWQANALLLEGAMPWDRDHVLEDLGFKMGPFAMSDLAGRDISWSHETSKGESLRDILCEADRWGPKNGKGFYDYGDDRTARPSSLGEQMIRQFVRRNGGEAHSR